MINKLLFTALLFVFTSNVFSQVPNYVPTNGLVGYWPFNGNANDESGNGNNGLTGSGVALTTDRFLISNSAYDFNGSGNISLTSLPTMGSQDFSISGWIKTNNLTLRKGIACWGQDSPWNSSYFYITDNGYLKFDFAYNGGPQSPIFVADNNWHSVLVTCTSGLIQLYLDGAATGTALTMTPNISGSNKSIGANIDNSGSNNFIGVLDDIGIWNRVLTPQEITNLYTSTVPVSCLPAYVPTSGLVGYWPFCGNANDESGNGNNGTVSGATLVSDRFGNANKAYNFDGSSNYISFPSGSSSSLNIISDLSLSFWIKSSTIQNNGIISFGDNTGGSGGYNVAHLSATNVNDVSFVSNNPSNSWLQTNATFNDNLWNNFVIAQKADTVRIYKNNSIVFTQTGYSYPLSYAGNRVIGTGSQLAYFFDGQIDDIGIWNRALTPAEITQLYSGTSVTTPVSCTPFLGEDQTVCAGTSVQLNVNSTSVNSSLALLETYSHDVGSEWTHNFSVVPGQTYTVRVSAQFSMGTVCPNFEMDPAYWIPPYNGGVALTHGCNSAWYIQNYCNGALGMRPTPDVYNPQHTYDYPIVANSNVLTVGFADCCLGDNCGSISFELHQSITSSTYLWSNGATTPTINVSPTSTTTYTCIVTTNGVSCTDEVTVIVNNPVIDLGADVTVCGTSTTLTAPTGYDSYLWSNGGTTNTTTVSANGTYSCTVTQGGCSAADSIDVTLINATITASDSVICVGDSVTLSVPQGGSSNTACAALPTNLQTGLLEYYPFCGNANSGLNNGNNGTVNGAQLTSDALGNTNAAYSFNGTNSSITFSNDFCGGQNLSQATFRLKFKVNSVGNAIWNKDGSWMEAAIYTTNSGALGMFWAYPNQYNGIETSPGLIIPNQWYDAVIIYDGVNSKVFLNGVLTTGLNVSCPSPAIAFGSSGTCGAGINRFGYQKVSCNPQSFFNGTLDEFMVYNHAITLPEIQQLYSLNSASILWSNGATTSTLNVSPTSTTTYTCTTTTNGVSCTDSVTVVVNNPTVDLGNDVTACGTSTTLTAPTGFDSYLWSNGATTNTTTVSANGTYSCTITQGGCSASDSIDVTLIDATITASDSVICAGETVTLSVPQGGSSNTACAALPTNLQTGLVGYWPFCGNANDASGNGNNGTVNGASLTADRFGNTNSAYSFDGVDDYVSTNLLGITGQNSRTIGFWFNSNNNNSGIKTMFGYGEHSSAIPHGSRFDCTLETGKPSIDIGYSFASYTVPNIQNNWKYYTVTYNMIDGVNVQAIKLYIDGELQSSPYLLSNSVIINTGNLNSVFFGAPYSTPSGNSFNGQLDDIAIYNRALSTSEIQQLYNLEQTTYLWSNGATTPTINVSPTTTTTYTCTTTTNGVSCSSNYTITVNNSSASTNIVTAFDSFTWLDGNTYTTSNNTATYTTTNAAGCDSVISLNLTITPNSPSLALQVFFDGYYINSSNPAAMTAARYNNLVASESLTPGAASDVDVITVELRSPYNLDVVAYSVSPILQTNGSVQCVFPAGALGGSFYIVVKHRAANPLWSANPIILTTSTTYDFANNLGSAYSDGDLSLAPMHIIVSGLYGIWLGELNDDGYLDATDYSNLELDIYASGYLGLYLLDGDFNGDTYVDASDFAVFDSNSKYGLYEQRPYAITTNVSIGQSYQGGIVAYILQPGDAGYDANVQHGLIAAPSDQGTAQWGCTWTTAVSGAYGQAIGTGAQNTIDIMNGCSEAGIAARLCGDLILDGYSDWYLPSLDELNKLSLNKVAIGGFAAGDFPISIYWSSTAFNNGNNDAAWGLFFYDGIQYPKAKVDYLSVRAVRAF